MNDNLVVGQVVGGKFGNILVRQKSGMDLEIGDLIVSEELDSYLILQVFELEYGSQIQDTVRQMISGTKLERNVDAQFYEPEFVNYVLARIQPLARIYRDSDDVKIPKSLPTFFNKLRLISDEDLEFLQKKDQQIFVGHIRSGSKVIENAEVWLPAQDIFSHHVLIPATTGRGKSNLVKTILWHMLDTNSVGALVLDAHDEYYGRIGVGLKDHPNQRNNLVYYTPSDPPPGAIRLVINLKTIRPEHFEGIVDFSEAQFQAIRIAFRDHKENWIMSLMTQDLTDYLEDNKFSLSTLMVVQRKLRLILSLELSEDKRIYSKHEVFDTATKGLNTVDNIVRDIEEGKVVVLDTSRLADEAELLVGNIIASKLLERYKYAKASGKFAEKPVATIVIEEAPRVIGEDVLKSKNDNIYSTIAKEGRKFKVGLTAITQLSSVIPKTILANMNTKIILGNEMKQEREAIIASASQDLSEDDKNIASLDKGEAIISSIFVPFAMPIKIPLFEDIVKARKSTTRVMKTKVF